MSITKPFTFVAGTKARANEVNQDFDVLYSQVNSNISAINTNANDIDTLDSNKANVNGSSSQRFACADPTSQSDAVNKQSMVKAIGNSINYIDGYVISKDSGHPNNTIIVSAGSCYDSTKTVVLNKANSSTKTNGSQGANTTYYVYVIGNSTSSQIDILISSSSTTPALPSGYSLFRQLGYYTTNGNNNIQTISYYGVSSTSDKSLNASISSMMPDWSRAVSKTPYTEYTATQRGWVNVRGITDGLAVGLKINNNIVAQNMANGSDDFVSFACLCPVDVGDTYIAYRDTNIYASTVIDFIKFIPCKGAI